MNIIPQSENLGNTVRVGGGGGPSNIKLQRDENGGQESEEDEEFMALMNESKSKEPGSAPFKAMQGCPEDFLPMMRAVLFKFQQPPHQVQGIMKIVLDRVRRHHRHLVSPPRPSLVVTSAVWKKKSSTIYIRFRDYKIDFQVVEWD